MYIDSPENAGFYGNLEIESTNFLDKILTSNSETNKFKFEKCNKISPLDSEFQNTFNYPIFCIPDQFIPLNNINAYLTRLKLVFTNTIGSIENEVKYINNYLYLDLEIYFPMYSYDQNAQIFRIGYNKVVFDMNDLAVNKKNIYNAKLLKNHYIFYNGYFDLRDSYYFYEVIDIEKDYSNTKDKDILLYFKINVPFYHQVIYFQTFSILYSLGVVSGWLYLLITIINALVSRCSRLKLYEAITNDVFSLITPEKVDEIEALTKKLKEKNDNDGTLESVVDDAFKYKGNDQLHLTFFQMISYLFCCDCFKSKPTRMLELTLTKGLNELFKTIDIINVVKTCQEMKLLKEIIFEPHQKRFFEQLIHPIVTSEEVKCAYDIEYMETKAKTEAEKDELMKGNLRDALIQLAQCDTYNDIEFTLISLFKLLPELKTSFFNLEQKQESVKNNFYDLAKSPNVLNKHEIIDNFEKYVGTIERNIKQLQYVNNSLIHEINEVLETYKGIYEENRILKEVVYGDLQLEAGEAIQEDQNSDKISNYHSVKEKASIKTARSKKRSSILKKQNGINQKLKRFFDGIFILVDSIFFLRGILKTINKEYTTSVRHSFEAIVHCIRISFITLIIFLYFVIVSISNNSKSSDCKVSMLCYGFLSYHRRSEDILTYTICLIIFMLALFIYTLNLIVKYYLTKNENDFIKGKYLFSKILFSAPTLKLLSYEEMTNHQENIITSVNDIKKYLNNTDVKSVAMNLLLITLNIILIGLNAFFTILLIQLFKNVSAEDYWNKLFALSIVLSVTTNVIPAISYFLIGYHRNLLPGTMSTLRFWIPFISKFSAYTFLLSSNLDIFMGVKGSDFFDKYTLIYEKERFICREDQAAYNLLFFMIIEFIMRKLTIITISILTRKKRLPYIVDGSISNAMCQFYILNTITLIFPIAGLFTFFIFCIDFHTEYIIIRKFKSKPISINNESKYELFSILCLIANLSALIIINVIFQNQYAIMSNLVPDIVENPSLADTYPPLCLHQRLEDDFQNKFRDFFSTYALAIYESVQNFILIPTLIGIIFVLIYSKNLLSKFSSDMKVLLTTYEDKNPKKKEIKIPKKKLSDYERLFAGSINNDEDEEDELNAHNNSANRFLRRDGITNK